MPDNKLYLIKLDGVEGQAVKDAAWYEQKKDDLFKKYPNAQIFEMSDYDENDSRDTDQYAINIKGANGTAIKDAAWYKEKKGALEEKYGNDASVKRLRAVDYWYDKAIADEKAIDVLNGEITRLRAETESEKDEPQYVLSNPYDPELSPEEYAAFEKELASMTDEQVAQTFLIDKLRAKVIHSGTLILALLVEKLNASKIILTEDDNLEGYYLWLEQNGKI